MTNSNGDAWGKGLRLFIKENWLIISTLIAMATAALGVQARLNQMELTWEQKFAAAQAETLRSLKEIEKDVSYIKGMMADGDRP